KKDSPTTPTTPAKAAQANCLRDGVPCAVARTTAPTTTSPAVWEIAATTNTGRRRVAEPAPKSAKPHARLALSASRTAVNRRRALSRRLRRAGWRGRGRPLRPCALREHRGDRVLIEHREDRAAQRVVRDLGDEELEEAFELVGVAAHRGRHRRGVDVLCGLERPHFELEPVAKPLDTSEHAHGVSFGEAGIEELDVVPDARGDAPARVYELEGEVRGAVPGPQALLLCDGIDPLDSAVLLKLRNRRHGVSLGLEHDHAADPVLGLHQLETAVHLVEL